VLAAVGVAAVVDDGGASYLRGEDSSPSRPPWQRLLQGADAKKAGELQGEVTAAQQAGKWEEAVQAAQELLDLRQKMLGKVPLLSLSAANLGLEKLVLLRHFDDSMLCLSRSQLGSLKANSEFLFESPGIVLARDGEAEQFAPGLARPGGEVGGGNRLLKKVAGSLTPAVGRECVNVVLLPSVMVGHKQTQPRLPKATS
jgi:hypothetical protein